MGEAIIPASQMLKMLQGTSGKIVTRELGLLKTDSSPIIGHDRANSILTIKIRPFRRCFTNESFKQSSKHSPSLGSTRSDGTAAGKPFSKTKSLCKTKNKLSFHFLTIMEDICDSSRFVHAQIWHLERLAMDLVYRGEHYTSGTFAERCVEHGIKDSAKKLSDLLTLNEASKVLYIIYFFTIRMGGGEFKHSTVTALAAT